MRKTTLLLFLCLAGALLNIAMNRLFIDRLAIPLFLDTIFTISLTLLAGPFWGALCGALTNLIYQTIWFWGWEGYLFALCSIATALVTWLFMRLFPRELNLSFPNAHSKSLRLSAVMERAVILIL